jgi:hypothetical protein
MPSRSPMLTFPSSVLISVIVDPVSPQTRRLPLVCMSCQRVLIFHSYLTLLLPQLPPSSFQLSLLLDSLKIHVTSSGNCKIRKMTIPVLIFNIVRKFIFLIRQVISAHVKKKNLCRVGGRLRRGDSRGGHGKGK